MVPDTSECAGLFFVNDAGGVDDGCRNSACYRESRCHVKMCECTHDSGSRDFFGMAIMMIPALDHGSDDSAGMSVADRVRAVRRFIHFRPSGDDVFDAET